MSIRDSFFNAKAVGALWDVAVSLKRGNPLPIDVDSVFESEAKLVEYIGDKVTTVAYPGQVVAVVNETSTQIFYLDQELNYHPVGSKLTADGTSIKVSDDVISLVGFDTAADGLLAQVKVDAEGHRTLNWVSIEAIAQGDGNTTYTFTGLDSETSVSFDVKASDAESAVKVYLDAYSKGEIDTKVSEIEGKIATAKQEAIDAATYDDSELAGRVSAVETNYAKKTDLPTIPENVSAFTNDAGYQTASQVETTVNTAIAETNHAVFKKVDAVPTPETAESNVLYLVPNGDKLDIYILDSNGAVICIDDTDADLSGYATDAELQVAVDRIATLEGKPHLSNTDVNGLIDTKLADYDTSTAVDGKVKVVSDKVDTHITDEAIHWTEEEVEAVAGTVAATKLADYTTTTAMDEKIAAAKQEAITAATYDDSQVTTEIADIVKKLDTVAEGAQANVIESVKAVGLPLEITEKGVDIPAATAEAYGLVKLGDEFSVNEAGKLEIGSVNVNKLVQTEGDILILDGGTADNLIV